jgi:hypothetical protein
MGLSERAGDIPQELVCGVIREKAAGQQGCEKKKNDPPDLSAKGLQIPGRFLLDFLFRHYVP